MSSPFEKAKARLVALGYQVGKTEHWNHFANIRQDLFGCIDLIALCSGKPILAMQVTDITSVSKRMAKAQAIAQSWVLTGNQFEIWGYTPKSKQPPRRMAMTASGAWVTGPWENQL